MKFFKNFKEKKSMKPNYSAEGIYGGACLGVRSGSFLCFYDWESTNLIRRIDIVPKEVGFFFFPFFFYPPRPDWKERQ